MSVGRGTTTDGETRRGQTPWNPLDLAKAKALGDAMTRMQRKDGDVPTHWGMDRGCSWWNCLLADVDAMNELAAVSGGR